MTTGAPTCSPSHWRYPISTRMLIDDRRQLNFSRLRIPGRIRARVDGRVRQVIMGSLAPRAADEQDLIAMTVRCPRRPPRDRTRPIPELHAHIRKVNIDRPARDDRYVRPGDHVAGGIPRQEHIPARGKAIEAERLIRRDALAGGDR